MQKFKRYFLVVLAVVSVSAVPRLVNLNSLPVFADESIYVRWSQIMRAEPTLRFLPLSDGKQPLYMWGTIPFLKIISDPLMAGRFFSALTGILTTVFVGICAYLLFHNRRLAVIAALAWAILPYAVFFDRMALADSLLAMFFVLAFIFSYLALRYSRLDMAMLTGFCLGFAWLTKSPAIYLFLLIPVLLVLLDLKSLTALRFIKLLGLLGVAYLIGFAMYNVLRLGPEFHMISLRNRDYIYPLAEILRHPLDPLVPHLKDSFQFYFYLATPFVFLLSVWGAIFGKPADGKSRLVLLLWWLLPVFSQSFIAKSFTARYLLFSLPFACILAASALENLISRFKKHPVFFPALSLLVFSCLWLDATLIFNPQAAPLPRIERRGYLEEWTAGQGIAEVSKTIRQAAQDGPVLVGSEGFFGTPFDGLGMYLNDQKNVRIIGVGVWIESVHEKLINALADNQVFLVVNSSRFHGDPQKLGVKLLASYPKAMPPSGEREYLLLFQVLKEFPR